ILLVAQPREHGGRVVLNRAAGERSDAAPEVDGTALLRLVVGQAAVPEDCIRPEAVVQTAALLTGDVGVHHALLEVEILHVVDSAAGPTDGLVAEEARLEELDVPPEVENPATAAGRSVQDEGGAF